MQVQNALHMGWVNYCAALITAKRMQEDIDGRTLIVHNGDVSYAECVCMPCCNLESCAVLPDGPRQSEMLGSDQGQRCACLCRGFVYGWNLFMDMMGPLVQQAPYMLTPGNLCQSRLASI